MQPAAERAARLAAMQGAAATVRLKIGGMTCGGCVGGVEAALAAVPGVENVAVDLEKGTAVVAGAASIARFRAQRLIQSVQDTGKEASLLEDAAGSAPAAAADHHHGHAHDADVSAAAV